MNNLNLTKKQAAEYEQAARADGWKQHHEHQSKGYYVWLEKEGWTMQIMEPHGRAEGGATIWAPDQLQIVPPCLYDWEEMQRRTRFCSYCKATNVDTVRVGFAGRVCENCRPDAAKILEKPGWCD